MYRWILLAFCCKTLCAAELMFEVDPSWTLVEQSEMADGVEFIQKFERSSGGGGTEKLFLTIEPRYSTHNERLSCLDSEIPCDSIPTMVALVRQFCASDSFYIHSFDDCSLLIEGCAESTENMLVATKVFLSEKRIASVIYEFSGDDLSKCDIAHWMNLIDQTAVFTDDETLPKLHHSFELDPSLWKEENDTDAVARTWSGPNESRVRALIAPRNVLLGMDIDHYLLFLEKSHEGCGYIRVLERDGMTALVESKHDQSSTTYFEKVSFEPGFIASLTCTVDSISEQQRQEWMHFLNHAQLTEDK